jgi:hypothetical protein
MEELIRHLTNIVQVDSVTSTLIILICCAAVFFIKDNLANPAMIVFIFPIIWFLSLFFYYIFVLFELVPSNKPDQWLMWVLMAGSVGVSVGIAIVAVIARLWDRPTAG